jgi:hypothetical protein
VNEKKRRGRRRRKNRVLTRGRAFSQPQYLNARERKVP